MINGSVELRFQALQVYPSGDRCETVLVPESTELNDVVDSFAKFLIKVGYDEKRVGVLLYDAQIGD